MSEHYAPDSRGFPWLITILGTTEEILGTTIRTLERQRLELEKMKYEGRSKSNANRFVFTRFSLKSSQTACQKKVHNVNIL